MNPNYTDIFGRLDWITKKVKYLLKTSGGGSGGGTGGATVDAEGNLIGVDNSNNTVNVAVGALHPIPDFSGMLIVNDHYDGGVEVWIAGGGNTTVLIDRTPYGPGPGVLTIDGGINGYQWKNDSGATGPFTFTVIKTRPGC